MATPTSYVFTISPVDTTALSKAIQTSSILTALDHIDTEDSAVTIWFKDILSDTDSATLTSLVSTYVYMSPVATQVPVPIAVQLDSDGATLSRTKQAPTGYTFQLRCFEFATATANSIVNNDFTNTAQSDIIETFYDADGNVLTDPTAISTSAVKSVFDFEPTYDYYIIGGELRMLVSPLSPVRFSVIAVPDIPYSSGGSKVMIQNCNLQYISASDRIQADGRAAKQLSYSATYHTNKLRFVFFHEAGIQVNIAFMLEFFRP